MGRIIRTIKIKKDPEGPGKEVTAIFDTGAERSYVKRSKLPDDVTCQPIAGFTSGLGGKDHQIQERCILNAEIEKLPFDISAHPIENIGIIDGEDIDVIVGATTMEEWDIRPLPKKKELDLTGLKKREFTEL
ncbi:MAG: hypothetical protein HWN65_07380 [Candidatus Helarchaeota archaeon]|nr:hypothetical protein [Candidatus Helarchaeota archaeon]